MEYLKTEQGLQDALAAAGGNDALLWMDSDSIKVLDAPIVIVPAEVSMRQARLALHGAGLLPGVSTAIAALPEPTKTQASIEWEYSTAVRRDSPLVQTLGTSLNLDATSLDDLFVAAAAIP